MITDHHTRRLQVAALLALLLISALAVNLLVRAKVDARADLVVLDQAPRPITVINGTCDAPGQPAWPLNDLAAPNGDAWGNTDTDRTQYSFTSNLPYTITALLEAPFAIVVTESADAPEAVLACANIGGITDQIGTLVVGFRSGTRVSVSGVAVLSPSAGDPTRSMVSAFLTGDSLGAFDGGDDNPPDASDPTVPVGEAEPTQAGQEPTQAPIVTPTDAPIVTPTDSPIDQPTVQPTDDDHDGDDDNDDDDDNSGHGGGDDDDSSGKDD